MIVIGCLVIDRFHNPRLLYEWIPVRIHKNVTNSCAFGHLTDFYRYVNFFWRLTEGEDY